MESLVIDIPAGDGKIANLFYRAITDVESIMSFFRLTYSGQVAKHRMEVKKAVFCETASQVVYRTLRDCFPGSLPYFLRLLPR
jgi:hypothetical protein